MHADETDGGKQISVLARAGGRAEEEKKLSCNFLVRCKREDDDRGLCRTRDQ